MVLGGARRARRDARLQPDARTTSTASPAREIDAWIVSERADAELAAARRRRVGRRPRRGVRGGQRRRGDETRRRESSSRAEPTPRPAAAGEAEARRPQQQGRRDRPRRRRAARPAHALHGRARAAPHPGRGARRRRRRAGPLAGDAEPDPHLARAAGDGHAGPHDPGRGRLPALPAPGPRPLDQARQAGRAGARRQGHRARPHRRRRARRPARPPRSATRSTTASSAPEERAAAGKPATGTLKISARHAGGNVVIEVRDDGRGIDPAGSPARPPSAG